MQRKCPILQRDTNAVATAFSKDAWQVVRCQETGFVYLADPPEYERLQKELAWERTYLAEKQRRRAEEPIFSRVSSLARRVKTLLFPHRNKFYRLLRSHPRRGSQTEEVAVLDVGCGSGSLLQDICRRLGQHHQRIVPLGIEISHQLSVEADAKFRQLGGRVVSASAIDGAMRFDQNSVDVIIMSSFLEHEAQPLSLLKQLRRTLRPGGVILIKVPNFACWNRIVRGRRWCGFRYPDHVNYFTPRTLKRLADEAQLPLCRQTLFDRFPLSDNMYAVLTKPEGRKNSSWDKTAILAKLGGGTR